MRILNIDATGGIVRKPVWTEKPVYIYNAAVQRNKGETPIPVSQFISDGHSQADIVGWLMRLKKDFLEVLKSTFPMPDVVAIDYSWAILHAVLAAFPGAKILIYLKMCKDAKKEGKVPFTMVAICYSHVLNRVSTTLAVLLIKRGTFTVKENLAVKRLALHTLAAILRTDTLADGKHLFHLLCAVFGSKYESSDVTSAYEEVVKFLGQEDEYVDEALQAEREPGPSDSESDTEDDNDTQESVRRKRCRIPKEVLYKDSPFYQDFLEEVNDPENIQPDRNAHSNEWYVPGFVNYLMKHYMPFYPLISCYLVREKGWTGENPLTTTIAEGSFRVLKHIDFGDVTNMPPDLFVLEACQSNLRTIKFVETIIPVKKYKLRNERTETQHEDKAKETWIKRKPRGLPAYSTLAAKLRYGKKDTTSKNSPDQSDIDDDLVALPDSSENSIQNPGTIARIPLTSTLTLKCGPWESNTVSYPPDWSKPKVALCLGGFDLLTEQRDTLLEERWVDGMLIDIFLQGVVNEGRKLGMDTCSFSTHLISGLMISQGQINLDFAERKNVHLKHIWFIPLIIRQVHWALAVVSLRHRKIIILDTRTDGTFRSIEAYTVVYRLVKTILNAAGLPSFNQKWTVHCPVDVHTQPNSNDCGLYLMLYAYSIVHQVKPYFSCPKTFRQWLANFLVSKDCRIPRSEIKEGTTWERVSILQFSDENINVTTEALHPEGTHAFLAHELVD